MATAQTTQTVARPVRQRASQYRKSTLFVGHLRLAWAMARKFSRRYGIPHAEAVAEAESALAVIIAEWNDSGNKGYDPTLCNPTSWIYRALYYSLLTTFTRKHLRERRFTDIEGQDDKRHLQATARVGWAERLMRGLSDDAQVVVRTILEAPGELAQELVPRRAAQGRGVVARYLGWEARRFEMAWAEVGDNL